ncbi:unnamed protein product [Lymnaea stagnalis]|uniref:Uncharacterized protein n=1 Tax=Lymnaea stagnalis TaxID=6523 RepID=A0AAV2IIY9_LYMST
MAPPGVNSFYDHLDTIMTFGSCFSPFSSSYSSSLMSPSSLKPALSPMSSRSFSYGLSVIHADHDYVIKPVVAESARPVGDVTTRLEGGTSACVEEGGCPAPGSDAMLSSAADFESTGEDNITDTDCLPDLDSIDFSLTDLDPCSDMAMEDSFQEFIDSALDKSSETFYGNDEEAAAAPRRETEAVVYNKEDFFHVLGLRPAGQTATVATPTSSSTQTLEAVPTKKSSCSGAETFPSIVYSTACNRHHHTVQTSPSTRGAHRNIAPSSPQVLLIPSLEFMTPLTIDTSFDIGQEFPGEFSRQAEDVTMVETSGETCEDSETHEFLKWLHDAHEPKTNDANNNEIYAGCLLAASMETGNSQKAVESPELDLESFIDLDDYIADSTTSYTGVAATATHAEQMSDSIVFARQTSQDGVSDLKLSFLSELSYRFHENERLQNDAGFDFRIKTLQHCHSSQSSPVGSHSVSSHGYRTWPSSESGSPAPSPISLKSTDPSSVSHLAYRDGAHLAMLDLFSEENAPALLHIEMSDQDIRFT